jgi:hypothetical protein
MSNVAFFQKDLPRICPNNLKIGMFQLYIVQASSQYVKGF